MLIDILGVSLFLMDDLVNSLRGLISLGFFRHPPTSVNSQPSREKNRAKKICLPIPSRSPSSSAPPPPADRRPPRHRAMPRTPRPLAAPPAPAGCPGRSSAPLAASPPNAPTPAPGVVQISEEHLVRCAAAGRAPLRVAVLLSGGVDSSVAIRLLHAAGHISPAVYLKMWFQVRPHTPVARLRNATRRDH